jgi:hypothetical protein
MSVFYAEVSATPYGGGWAVRDTPEAALKAARSNAGNTARTERGSYVLEFPDNAEPTIISDFGGWRANAHPIRVVSKHKVKASDAQLLGQESH